MKYIVSWTIPQGTFHPGYLGRFLESRWNAAHRQ